MAFFKYFSYFSLNIGFDITSILSSLFARQMSHMKYALFSLKNTQTKNPNVIFCSCEEIPEDMRKNKAFNPYGLNALFFLMSSGTSEGL